MHQLSSAKDFQEPGEQVPADGFNKRQAPHHRVLLAVTYLAHVSEDRYQRLIICFKLLTLYNKLTA